MNWLLGIVLASSLACGLASTASGQEFDFPGEVVEGPLAGGGFVNGGFGNTYVQPPPVSGIPGNRWDMLAGPSYFEGIPYGESFVERQPVRVDPRARANGRVNTRGPAPYRTPLPMTRLYGDGGMMPAQYAPFNRHQAYGSAYGLGPYGSNYYSEYWHGQPINGIYP